MKFGWRGALGIARERVSIVARSHDEEGVLAKASDSSPGVEIEDSLTASTLEWQFAATDVAMMLAFAALTARYPRVAPKVLQEVFKRHGSLSAEVLGDGDLGEHFGAGLTEREVRYFVEREWARTADDVLWRRSKAGLHLPAAQRARVAEVLGA